MRRRALLASMAALGGCIASPTIHSRSTHGPTDTPPPRTEDVGCPPPLSSDTEVVCTGSGRAASIRTTVSPSALALPRDRTRLTFHNGSDGQVRTSPHDYQLYARSSGRWQYVLQKAGAGVGRPPVDVAPGESRQWTIVANTADLDTPNPPSASDDDRTLTLRFTPGTYAFGVPATPASEDQRRLYTARFSVSGESPPLVPTSDLVSHARRGTTLVVRTRTETKYDTSRRVSLLVDRLDATPRNAADLTLFELFNPSYEVVPDPDRPFVGWPLTVLLRDAFAFVEPSDRHVRVETVDTTVPPLGLAADDSLDVTYAGRSWRLTTRDGWA